VLQGEKLTVTITIIWKSNRIINLDDKQMQLLQQNHYNKKQIFIKISRHDEAIQ